MISEAANDAEMSSSKFKQQVPPPAHSRQAKSPYLVPVLEDLAVPDDEDIFSLDSRAIVEEPFSFDASDGSEDEDEQEKEDESVHIQGVPRSSQRFDAKRYATPEFAAQLLILLRDELRLPGWADLPANSDVAGLSIDKVTGACTNAVFFVSCPLQEGISPPTVLVRVYGPCSESLLSRRQELHILHTLSAEYHFGPHVLGTFANGRVEEYFESKALNKDLIRDPRLSCWIARRMRELHAVNPDLMQLPELRSPALRPVMNHRNSSNISLLSTSSSSSVFSFGSSASTSSLSSRSRSVSREPSTSSSLPRTGVSEVPAVVKRRSFHSSNDRKTPKRRRSHDSLGVWMNISSWTREGSRVLKLMDHIASQMPQQNGHSPATEPPLSSPAAFKRFVAELDLPRFEKEVQAYRVWVSKWEKQHGRAKRVFAHNDAQYGNVLLRQGLDVDPLEQPEEAIQELGLQKPHELLIVVDFEYAALNPRGFDVANHFIEWMADYHCARSHALDGFFPSLYERRRFYRAYIGCDGGDEESSEPPKSDEEEDPRVLRLEEEVRVWTPASHAWWAVWGLVQARETVQEQIDQWTSAKETSQLTPPTSQPVQRPHIERGKSGEGSPGDDLFPYLLYTQERMAMFRQSLKELEDID